MIRCGKYKHFKGNEYVVMDVGTHTETGEKLVIYYDCTDPSKIWVRPLDMFIERVDRDEYKGPRFIWIGD